MSEMNSHVQGTTEDGSSYSLHLCNLVKLCLNVVKMNNAKKQAQTCFS